MLFNHFAKSFRVYFNTPQFLVTISAKYGQVMNYRRASRESGLSHYVALNTNTLMKISVTKESTATGVFLEIL